MICNRGHVLTSWSDCYHIPGKTPRCKRCQSEDEALRKAMFPTRWKEQVRERGARYRRRYPERVKAAQKRWRDANPDRRLELQRAYREKQKARSIEPIRDPWSDDTPISSVGCLQPRSTSGPGRSSERLTGGFNGLLGQDLRPGPEMLAEEAQ